MKKKIKDLTEDERRNFCEKYKDCSFCPLNDFDLEREVEVDEKDFVRPNNYR